MRPRNTKGKIEFVMDHVFWEVIVWIWYKNILFRCVGYRSSQESKWILIGFLLLVSIPGILLQFRRRRNDTSIFMNICTGFGLYAVLTYYEVNPSLVRWILIAAAVFAALYSIVVLCRRIGDKSRVMRILGNRLKRAGRGIRVILSIGLLSIMLIYGTRKLLGTVSIIPSTPPAKQSEVEEQTIANNMDTLILLREENWETLSLKEKLNVLQTVANIERRYLGLPHELNVGATILPEGVVAFYHDGSHQIAVGIDSLLHDPSFELVNSIAHEAYHGLQYRMVDAYDEASEEMKSLMFYDAAAEYKKEFEHYVNGTKDFYGYYGQKCEQDARQYALEAVADYFNRIG